MGAGLCLSRDSWPGTYRARGRASKFQLLRVPARPCSPDSGALYAPTTKSLSPLRKVPESPAPQHILKPSTAHPAPAPPPTSPAIRPPTPSLVSILEHTEGLHTSVLLNLLFTWVRCLFLHFLFLVKFYLFKSSVTCKGLYRPICKLDSELPVPWLLVGQDWPSLSGSLTCPRCSARDWAHCYC